MSSLPVYIYFAIMVITGVVTVLFFICATCSTALDDELDDESFCDDSSIIIDKVRYQAKKARVKAAKKIRSMVIGSVFPTEVMKRKEDLNPDPEATTVMEYEDGSRDTTDETCSICFEHFEEGDIIATTQCAHMFHHDCILGWSRIKSDRCPVCQQAMWESKTFERLENEISKQQIQESCVV